MAANKSAKSKNKSVKPKIKPDMSEVSSPVVARSDDGTIQITFTIAWNEIDKSRNKAIEELGREIEIPGFRKGMAPASKVAEKIPQQKLIEKTLSEILPRQLGVAISENNLKIAIYPKFELINAKDGEDWQIRAVTCEIPNFELGNYKQAIRGAFNAGAIWTPDKAGGEEKKQISTVEKEQKILEILVNTVKPTVPKILIDEEVNARLSQLLERIEKLGLTLEGYLASIGKNPQSLRQEYETQSHSAISIELILNKIAEDEGVKVDTNEIDNAIKAGSASEELQQRLNSPEQRNIIESVLKRRKALDFLLTLA
jgi:FKBP-type peptidyl-prolyl cis-trans isomerase (trigger factor)